MSIELLPKHSRWIRWTHWLNFPLLALMLWSGILIYWANDVYRPFFPEWFYETFRIHHRLARGMAIHFLVMWPLVLNGLVYALYLLFSGKWRELVPDLNSFRKAPTVVKADLGFGPPPQHGKFNAAQRIAYTGVVLMGIGSVASGLGIYKPVQLTGIRALLGGYETARLIHFALALGYVAFFVVHVIQVLRAGWNTFRSMIAGFEVKK